MDKIKEDKNYFIEDKPNYTPFTNYNLNGCIYLFSDVYKGSQDNYYNFKNNKYYKIKINKIGTSKFIKLRDINGNNIIVIL